MKKDFDKWNEIKTKLHENNVDKFYHAREVWWCSLGVNIGFEQDGDNVKYRRPVLILKGLSKNTCLIIPMTTSLNKHPMRVSLGIIDGKESSAIISQMRVVDTKRLAEKICFANKDIFENIRKIVKDML